MGASNQRSRWSEVRREVLVLGTLVTAVMLLLWNGTSFFHNLREAGLYSREIQVASTALTLNVALVLFGWRRYVDLQHEAETSLEHERQMALIASTDNVTGLFNRKGFSDRADALADEAAERGERLVVMSFQIHRFKAINDQHGYDLGDRLLATLADRMREEFGASGCIARLSGDEFAIATTLPEDKVEDCEIAVDRLLRSIARPITFDDRVVQVSAFAGIAAGDPDIRIPDLLRRADIATDRARSGRLSRPVWFDAGMERALIAQSEIEQGIRYGLEHGQFVPFFEPQIDLKSGELVGFEVLARWNHPLTGVIAPDVFIPIAEDAGLIGRLSEQVITAALRTAAEWSPVSISVNISPGQLSDGWLAQRIIKILTETGFPAERLVVEITESSLFADMDFARSTALSLKNQGIRLALDDFGTGFSSLSHLRSLPFDIIKIDRSFVTNLAEKRDSMAIVKAVTTLASALSVPVSIEGIENEAALRAVIGLGCAVGQGWYLGKPMPADQAFDLLVGRTRAEEGPAQAVAPSQNPPRAAGA